MEGHNRRAGKQSRKAHPSILSRYYSHVKSCFLRSPAVRVLPLALPACAFVHHAAAAATWSAFARQGLECVRSTLGRIPRMGFTWGFAGVPFPTGNREVSRQSGDATEVLAWLFFYGVPCSNPSFFVSFNVWILPLRISPHSLLIRSYGFVPRVREPTCVRLDVYMIRLAGRPRENEVEVPVDAGMVSESCYNRGSRRG
jgi:hypothetical protein